MACIVDIELIAEGCIEGIVFDHDLIAPRDAEDGIIGIQHRIGFRFHDGIIGEYQGADTDCTEDRGIESSKAVALDH